MKGKIPELSKALKNGRAPLELKVENTLYTKATGMKVKVQQAIKVKDVYYDEMVGGVKMKDRNCGIRTRDSS